MNKIFRAKRTRAKIHGTAERPRLSVHFSNQHITAQIIDDDKKMTLAYATTVGAKMTGSKTEKAAKIGAEIAKKAKAAKVSKVGVSPQQAITISGSSYASLLAQSQIPIPSVQCLIACSIVSH